MPLVSELVPTGQLCLDIRVYMMIERPEIQLGQARVLISMAARSESCLEE